MDKKPLGRKAYGSIPHLPGSKLGPGDHHITEGQSRILTEKTRDKHDQIYVHEKLDGSNVCVAKLDDYRIVALSRAGYLVESSPYVQHHIFGDWVYANQERFQELLKPSERVCGEWLAQAHGVLYELNHEPFVAFDLFSSGERLARADFLRRLIVGSFVTPTTLMSVKPSHDQKGGCVAASVDQIVQLLQRRHLNYHGAKDPKEGAVWRCERNGKVEFLAKWVRPDFIPGKYLPEVSGGKNVWNEGLDQYLPPKALDRLKEAGNYD